ncbi:MAG TPA: hypothetical protein VEV44_00480 [Pseudoneobacillus sp.]|nr:hypothetical protein [Pseudoneobacillus sp.]
MNKESLINNSGNSKVDVAIHVDTTALAYFMGSYLHAIKHLDDDQYLLMMNNLYLLLGKDNEYVENLLSNFNLSNAKVITSENTLKTLKKYY